VRVLLTGGGTAGHINPALAIAQIIRANEAGSVIEFVGIKGGKEEDLVPREGYPLRFVESMGIERSLSPRAIKALFVALRSPKAKQTQQILDEFSPDLVIGTGGFTCWPIMAAAAKRGIPTALHESNALPGLAVRMLQGRVDRIWTNFEKSTDYLRRKAPVLRVGNPLRGEFGAVDRERARAKLKISPQQTLILSFGGSLGAEEVNKAALSMMKLFSARHPDIVHLHAAGSKKLAECKKIYDELGLGAYPNCILTDYIYDMPLQMAAADLVICRAGAMTLSELAKMKKCAILIPSPNVTDNHQYVNAKTVADAGAAILVEEKTLAAGTLRTEAEKLLTDPARMRRMENSMEHLADLDTNRLIWEDIVRLLGRK
jgi:UDP-N-acetylglucosamine--N-acetylmuramyl-(pentapeptide) pyrophosphoryl-undecaprenol N-acetylglucosamine transferase